MTPSLFKAAFTKGSSDHVSLAVRTFDTEIARFVVCDVGQQLIWLPKQGGFGIFHLICFKHVSWAWSKALEFQELDLVVPPTMDHQIIFNRSLLGTLISRGCFEICSMPNVLFFMPGQWLLRIPQLGGQCHWNRGVANNSMGQWLLVKKMQEHCECAKKQDNRVPVLPCHLKFLIIKTSFVIRIDLFGIWSAKCLLILQW